MACGIASGMVVQIVDRAMLSLIESTVFTFIGHSVSPFSTHLFDKRF